MASVSGPRIGFVADAYFSAASAGVSCEGFDERAAGRVLADFDHDAGDGGESEKELHLGGVSRVRRRHDNDARASRARDGRVNCVPLAASRNRDRAVAAGVGN